MAAGRIGLSVFALCLVLSKCSAIVPLFGWSNSDAFSGLKGDQFSSANELIYDATLDNVDVIIIFKSPELSFDNLAKYGGLYGGKNPALSTVQSEMKSSKSSVLAGVDGSVAADFLSTLSFVTDVKPVIVTGAEGLTQHKLIQVELLTSSDEEGALAEQDDVISEVMTAVKAFPGSPSYAAIYTSSHTHMSRPDGNRNELRRSANSEVYRAPRQANEGEGGRLCYTRTVNGTGTEDGGETCMAFCFTNTTIIQRNASDPDLTKGEYLDQITILGGSCGNDSVCSEYGGACLHFTARVNGSNADVADFTFIFRRGYCRSDSAGDHSLECGFWTMDLQVNGNDYLRGGEETQIYSPFTVPKGTSYACGENRLNTFRPSNTSNSGASEYAYSFLGLQVQVYSKISYDKLNNPVFGSAYNCQGYLTHIPFMGLITSLILLGILYCSVAFMFSVQTMDRFDDPRGPTISVENLH